MIKQKILKSGFTLLELLVVVLIIGILATIAIPQYRRAVEKSRGAQVLSLLHTLAQSTQEYYLVKGEYPNSWDELSVDIPWTENQKWHRYGGCMLDTKSNGNWSAQLENCGNLANWFALYIGRLSGSYAGGGFAYVPLTNQQNTPLNQIFCVEQTTEHIPFSTTIHKPGDYCNKLFNATFVESYSSLGRVYKMP